MGGEPQALAPADSAWWRMEEPDNPMTITGVLVLDEPLPAERLEELVRTRLLRYERFRQRIVETDGVLGRPRWVEDERFSLDHHLERVALPEPADQSTLEALVSELMSTPLDPTRPLWRFHYVERYRGGSALVARVHHCIADGLALVQVLLSLDDAEPARPARPPTRGHRRMESLVNPARILAGAKLGGLAVGVLGRLLTMRGDPRTVFRGDLSTRKRAAWSEPIPLDDIKFIGRRLGGTVNDVLLCAVAGALQRYIRQREGEVNVRNLRAVIPVNLRAPGEVYSLGNKFGLVFLTLPVGLRHPLERFRALKRSMDRLKRSPEAVVIFGVLRVLGKTAEGLLTMVVNLLGKNATAVVTNVPGPREPVYFCGTRIRNLMFWVPQSGRLGLGVSILSYTGEVRVGVATDAALVPDPEAIVAAYHAALDEIMEQARTAAAGTG